MWRKHGNLLSAVNYFRAPWSPTGQVPVLRLDLTLRQHDLTPPGRGPARHPPDLSLLTPSIPARWEEDDPCHGPPPAPPPPWATRCPRHLRAMPARRHQNDGRDHSTWPGLRRRLTNCRLSTRSASSRRPGRSSGSPWRRDSVRRDTPWRRRERSGCRMTSRQARGSCRPAPASSPWWRATLTPCQPAPPCLIAGQSVSGNWYSVLSSQSHYFVLYIFHFFHFRNLSSLGILRHFARVGSSDNNVEVPREAHENSRNGEHQVHASSHPIDYRFQPAEQSEVTPDTRLRLRLRLRLVNNVFNPFFCSNSFEDYNQIGLALFSLKVLFYNWIVSLISSQTSRSGLSHSEHKSLYLHDHDRYTRGAQKKKNVHFFLTISRQIGLIGCREKDGKETWLEGFLKTPPTSPRNAIFERFPLQCCSNASWYSIYLSPR